jgi:antitoxin SocA-like protein
MDRAREYDPERLAELIMYVAQRSLGDPRFGGTKLNKILFFADFEAYRRLGQSITGATYQHLPQGPCAHQLLPVIDSVLANDAKWVERSTYAGTQRQLIPLRPARVELFTGPEVAIIEEVLTELGSLTNTQVSQRSHETVSWQLTQVRDEIPYGTALLSHEPPTEDDLLWLEGVEGGEVMEASTR